jgi:hypothetical protein
LSLERIVGRHGIDSEVGLPDVSSERSHKALHQDWQ